MRWIVRLLAVLGVLGIAGAGILALIPSDRVARLAVDHFKAVTGRELTIEGALRPSLWPVLGVETGRITLANAPWSKAGPMLVADGLSIKLDLAALLSGQVRVTGFALQRPDILLERSGKGLPNWVFGGSNGGTASADMPGADRPFTLDRATITGGRLRFLDHASGQSVQASDLDATLSLPDYAGPLDLTATATVAGQALALDARLDDFAAVSAGQPAPVALTARVGAARLRFDGRAGAEPPAAEGTLDADLADLSALAALLGIDRPALPQGLGARHVAIAGQFTLQRGAFLRQGQITLDDTTLAADLDLDLDGPRPRLTGRLSTKAWVLGEAASGGGGGSGGTRDAAGWSDSPLSADGLRAFDADLSVRADQARLAGLGLTGLDARVTVQGGRAVLAFDRASAYDGTLAGQVVINAKKGLSVAGRFDLTDVALEPLLTDLAGYGRLSGTGTVTLDLLSAGGSLNALMHRLEGQGQVEVTAGRLDGLDLSALLADPTGASDGSTLFDQLGASFRIDQGVLQNDDLSLTSPLLRATGKGRIGIGARDIDYRLRVSALQGADGQDRLTLPILVTGPWAAPRILPDLQAMAEQRLGDQAKAASEELKSRAATELGQQPGESLEDAAKRKLQDKLNEQAGSLLQDLLKGN